ncbi:hypothetical protein AX14_007544, partial [Amanita brunnescens Koide BX004]
HSPNLSLFSPEGKWFQTDYANPLEGWSLDEVVKAGKAKGAQPEDIYGCLYFFLSEQLREFHLRLRRFPVSLNVYPLDAASALPQGIRDGVFTTQGVPATICFDRIKVSNILDANYVGIYGVLTSWGPLLADGGFVAVVGHSMNWVVMQEEGDTARAGPSVVKALMMTLGRRLMVRPKQYLKHINVSFTDGPLLKDSRHQYILEVHPSHVNAGINLRRMGFKRLPFSPHPINEATNTSALNQSPTPRSKHYMYFAFIKGLQPAHIMGLSQV